jgi:AraC-like DNA-binding protein
MSTLQEYIAVIGSSQGFLLFGLLVADARMTIASRILGVICLMVAITFVIPFLLTNADNSAIGWTIGLVFFLPVALGPLGYLYSRSALLGTPLTKKDLLHLIPWLFSYALTADVSIADPQAMVKWINGAEPQNLRLQISEYVPVALASIYAGWTGWIIWRYRRQANDNLANFDPSIFNWLLTLQAFNLVVWFLKTLPGFTFAPTIFSDAANLFLVILIYVIAIMQWRNPQFFTIPSLSEQQSATVPAGKKSKAESVQDGELDPVIRAELFETAKNRLERDKLYLDSNLTLTRLSDLTGVNKHHLSEVLNRHAGKNFYEFINGYRVDFVRKRLAEDTNRTILDIALEAGFSSKSTFNAIFKQFTGQTPTQYRKAKAGNDLKTRL